MIMEESGYFSPSKGEILYLLIMPDYKQNPHHPHEKLICLHVQKKKIEKLISRRMELMQITVSMFIMSWNKERKESENHLKDVYTSWHPETSGLLLILRKSK